MGDLCVDGKVILQLILYDEIVRMRNLINNVNDRDHLTGYFVHRNQLSVCQGLGSNSGAAEDLNLQGYSTVRLGKKYLTR
jgi:hypothetical protein